VSEASETQEWTISIDPISGEVVAIRVATEDEIEEWELAHPEEAAEVDEGGEWILV
jgi:hypothetical protein